jgi:hypothetical protein
LIQYCCDRLSAPSRSERPPPEPGCDAETNRSNFKNASRQPDGATLSGPSAKLADADNVQSTGAMVGLFWEAMESVGCGDWVG